ncbi:MAG: S8 family serine peptidase, partial [Oscillochloris sp.]|nr:S8 family serine peptidase [Oscillochloris sp.]
MRSFTPLLTLVALLIVSLFALPAQAQPAATNAVPGELIVRLQPEHQLSNLATPIGVAAPALVNAMRTLGVAAAEPLGADSYLLRYRSDLAPELAAAQLYGTPGMVYAEPNYYRQLYRTPNDSVINQQWALRNIQAYEAWDITTGGSIVIAVLDTGVDSAHPDLKGKVLPGYNAYSGGDNSDDDNGHGTAVSGLIAANTDNNAGVAGLCWGCRILPVKVLRANGGGTDAAVAQGIRWAVDNGANVLNLSLGGTDDSQVIRDAINYAVGRGILVVAASGNEQQEGNAPSYPAAYPDVLAVGATGNTDIVTGFSNTGDYVDISAPGVGLWTTLPGGGYGPPNGTSFSSPYVAAAAGLVLTLRSDLGFFDVSCVLMASADDKGAPGKDPEYGYGRLNALRALQLAQTYNGCPLTAPVPDPLPQPAPEPQPAPQPAP